MVSSAFVVYCILKDDSATVIMNVVHEAGAILARELTSELNSSEEVILVDKRGDHVCKRSKPRYVLRKRRQDRLVLDSEQDSEEKIAKRSDDLSDSGTDKEHQEKGNQENSRPISENSWRSRCGRKRKYFGQESIRKGATNRERNRFNAIQEAFEELRKVIPKEQHPKVGRLSKFATLKLATAYITMLGNALEGTEKIDEMNQWGTLKVLEHKNSSQDDSILNRRSELGNEELYIGDFTDILYATDENEGLNCYDELRMDSPMECYTSVNAILIR